MYIYHLYHTHFFLAFRNIVIYSALLSIFVKKIIIILVQIPLFHKYQDFVFYQ